MTVVPARIEIVDEVVGEGRHRVVASVHLAADTDVAPTGDALVDAGPLRIDFDGPPETHVEVVPPGTDPDGWVATGFGHRQPAATVRVTVDQALPFRLRTTVTARETG